MNKLILAASIVVAAGCNNITSVDACAKYAARTCISIEVKATHALSVDQIEVAAASAPGLVPSGRAVSPSPAGASFPLPIAVAVLPDAAFSGGFTATVRGLVSGNAVGATTISGTVTKGQHLRLVATLGTPTTTPGDMSQVVVPDAGDGGTIDMAGMTGSTDMAGTVNVAAPRPVAPLSTATVTSQTPTLRWSLPSGADGAHVELCSDHACAHPIGAFDATGSSGAPTTPLPPGVVFWRLRGRVGGGTGNAVSVTWEMNVGKHNATVNTSYGTRLDVDGDGFADLLVAAPKVSYTSGANTFTGSGAAYVYHGAASWKLGTVPAVASTLLDPALPSSGFGTVARSAGDVNGDGYADVLIVKVPDSASGQAGEAFIFTGGPNGLGSKPMPASTIVKPNGGNDQDFAISGVAAGDLDGDGYADIAIGSLVDKINLIGTVYIYRGGPNGLGANPQPAWTLLQPTNMLEFGAFLAEGGDINGDGYSDLTVTAAYGLDGSNKQVGAFFVFEGGPTKFNAGTMHPTSEPAIVGTVENAVLGDPIALAGDVNGDGYADLLVGLTQQSGPVPNSAFIYFGSGTGLTNRATLSYPNFISAAGSDLFVAAISDGGDLDGDGFSDVNVGATGYNSNRGVTFFYSGTTVGGGASVPAKAAFQPADAASGDAFGGGFRVGDFDGDGLCDLFVGSPGATVNSVAGTGKGHVIFGVSGGYNTSTLTGTSLAIPAPASGGAFGSP